MGWDMDHFNIDGLGDMEGMRHTGVGVEKEFVNQGPKFALRIPLGGC